MGWVDEVVAKVDRGLSAGLGRFDLALPDTLADVRLERSLRAAAAASERDRHRIWSAWRGSVARHERRLARARGALIQWPVIGAGAVALTFPASGLLDVALGVTAFVATVRTGHAGAVLARRAAPPPAPVLPPALPPPPPRASAAFSAVRRLEAVRTGLFRALTVPPHTDAPVFRDYAAAAIAAAGGADLALRATAVHVAWVETLGTAGAYDERGRLLALLDTGVRAQEDLLAAATEAALAHARGAADLTLPLLRLQEATDALSGFAAGLREVTALQPPR